MDGDQPWFQQKFVNCQQLKGLIQTVIAKSLLIVRKVYLYNLRLWMHEIGCHKGHSRQTTN